ncbi:hypothetical protein BJX62DRAFT_192759 [Aspergillus germanicus]
MRNGLCGGVHASEMIVFSKTTTIITMVNSQTSNNPPRPSQSPFHLLISIFANSTCLVPVSTGLNSILTARLRTHSFYKVCPPKSS